MRNNPPVPWLKTSAILAITAFQLTCCSDQDLETGPLFLSSMTMESEESVNNTRSRKVTHITYQYDSRKMISGYHTMETWPELSPPVEPLSYEAEYRYENNTIITDLEYTFNEVNEIIRIYYPYDGTECLIEHNNLETVAVTNYAGQSYDLIERYTWDDKHENIIKYVRQAKSGSSQAVTEKEVYLEYDDKINPGHLLTTSGQFRTPPFISPFLYRWLSKNNITKLSRVDVATQTTDLVSVFAYTYNNAGYPVTLAENTKRFRPPSPYLQPLISEETKATTFEYKK